MLHAKLCMVIVLGTYNNVFVYSQLLDYEAKAADQVPLLMRLRKDDLALEKAIVSGDTDLGTCAQLA